MEKEVRRIEVRQCDDLGPVVARADHQRNAIEVNAAIFYKMPPMVQEWVLCHEVCHLAYGERDEARTNQLAAGLYLGRAADEADRARRADFLAYLAGKDYDYSNEPITATAVIGLVTGVVTLGSTVFGVIKSRNAGWYSWDDAEKRRNLDVLLTNAFEGSRRTNTESAADIFWQTFQAYAPKDGSLDRFLSRSSNAWVKGVIAKYEASYGFGFAEVTPIDWLSFPAVKIGLALAAALAVFLIVKKARK